MRESETADETESFRCRALRARLGHFGEVCRRHSKRRRPAEDLRPCAWLQPRPRPRLQWNLSPGFMGYSVLATSYHTAKLRSFSLSHALCSVPSRSSLFNVFSRGSRCVCPSLSCSLSLSLPSALCDRLHDSGRDTSLVTAQSVTAVGHISLVTAVC